ncbi:3-oxoacyl-ACP reductase FabG [Planctomyces sp. SH-PL62]|uniref:3-oxoacyl-ACP reductase FabG n=1 Tax=Planctomyces sp. SH-PL62 TaxID=1636152 RepID=UPI00078B3FFE|nr:3-oxoacyl-ACP reductase FabG [Planctomyces sp. SH-PL62]AMV41009.1 3-oxoacyl-[acyl-carrier-protein] reductase FabG [Planctomyces sp. SH-PL62]
MIGIDLGGKVALVTGAGQGLGRATATRLHAAGAAVVVNYPPDPAGRNAATAQEFAVGLGDHAAALPADVRDVAQVDAMMSAIRERFGRLDVVVNNAAVIRDRTVKKMTDEDWRTVVDTDLTGVFQVCRAAAAILSDGGRIVNIASISGVVGFFGQANYAAAKAGVIALTKVLSKELASRRITVNAVAPGVVLTDMGKTIPEEVRARMLAEIPLNRFGEPEEIADAILFLASDLASYLTGQTLHVNGGWWS